jgi:aryl-alcohol dehydrogenase-like predicted oxidoreductase
LLHQPFPVIPIIGTVNPNHLADALGAVDVSLTEEQVRWLRDG